MSDLFADLKYTIIPGETFKELFGFFTFYKLTYEPETEKNKYPLDDGLNEIEITQKNGFVDGGIVFNIQLNLFGGMYYRKDMYEYIREVEVIDDAIVFIDDHGFKASKLILKERKPLGESEIWKDIVIKL